MQSLNELSFATLFEYLANKPLDKKTKELFVSYLTENKSIVDKYLSRESVYGVFHRGKDVGERIGEYTNKYKQLALVKQFGTFNAAYKWILKYGVEIVDGLEYDHKTTIVLTIIELFPNDNHEKIPTTTPIISNQHPTFAFSKNGYNMLVNEHEKWFLGSWSEEIFCDWIYLVEDNSLVVQGCSWENAVKLSSYLSGDDQEDIMDNALAKFKKIDYSLQNHSNW